MKKFFKYFFLLLVCLIALNFAFSMYKKLTHDGVYDFAWEGDCFTIDTNKGRELEFARKSRGFITGPLFITPKLEPSEEIDPFSMRVNRIGNGAELGRKQLIDPNRCKFELQSNGSYGATERTLKECRSFSDREEATYYSENGDPLNVICHTGKSKFCSANIYYPEVTLRLSLLKNDAFKITEIEKIVRATLADKFAFFPNCKGLN